MIPIVPFPSVRGTCMVITQSLFVDYSFFFIVFCQKNNFQYIALSLENWIIASRVAVVTINGGIAGGFSAVLIGVLLKRTKGYILDITQLVTGILGGLVAITAGADVFRPWEGMIVGYIGGIMANGGEYLFTDSSKQANQVKYSK